MPCAAVLDRDFFARPVLTVAADLLGRHLLRDSGGGRVGGRIVEVEAYAGESDPASHAFRGLTPRTRVMFGPPGHAYVYLVYGMHHCLNLVCEKDGQAAAVLIRALEPIEGQKAMAALRPGIARRDWARGPGRLCSALAISRELDGLALPSPALWLEEGVALPAEERAEVPRIGVGYAGKAALWPWRLYERDSLFVSRSPNRRKDP